MRERGCCSTTTPAQPRRTRRPRHPYAVPRTSVQCVCTQRRNCIEQLSPFSAYAPGTVPFPVRNSATIKLTHYRRRLAPPSRLGLNIQAREMSERSSGWSREFDEPVVVADGGQLVTPRDAAKDPSPLCRIDDHDSNRRRQGDCGTSLTLLRREQSILIGA